MYDFVRITRRLWSEGEGATLIEYGLLLFLIALICIAAVESIGTKVGTVFSTLNGAIP